MAIDAFLALQGVTGESVVRGMEGKIDVLAWSWGATQRGAWHTATGGGAGKVQVENLRIVHTLDKASPTLWQCCCSGKHFPSATLTFRKAGDWPLNYLVIALENVLISRVAQAADPADGGLESPVEIMTLNFSRFTYTYQPQDARGNRRGEPVSATYDIAAASK